MENEVRVVLFGLGPMGKLIAKGILEKKGIRIVGAVDIACLLYTSPSPRD